MLKSGTIVKIDGVPLSLCEDVEVEFDQGNAGFFIGGSREIFGCSERFPSGPIGKLPDEKPVV